ncbi:unnamed protein product [Symbiodinium natans]|uniref:Transmembrane protein n=1 Tax=Symbiodinium natans TaxID=878477 RepID=A0A812QSZ4_9DINO|nr:unnamed protein product [Symbiodinium natans]
MLFKVHARLLGCVLELAAFLKSQDGKATGLCIRPTFLGPCAVVLFLINSASMIVVRSMQGTADYFSNVAVAAPVLLVIFTCLGSLSSEAFRDFFRKLASMQEQLPHFRLQDAACHCCDIHHFENGQRVPCDREVVNECIGSWFGSPREFEGSVHSMVLPAMETQLGYYLFPYHIFLGCSIPVLWAHFDGMVYAAIDQDWAALITRLLYVAVRWLGELPIFFAMACPVMWKLRHRRARRFADLGVNVLCMWLPLSVYYGMYLGGEYLRSTWGLRGHILLLVMLLAATAFLWRFWTCWLFRSGISRSRQTASSKDMPEL